MSDTLRTDLIRLAAAKPELREHLLPLLDKQAAASSLTSQVKLLQGLNTLIAQQIKVVAAEGDLAETERAARILMATGARVAHMGVSVLLAVAAQTGNTTLEAEAKSALTLTQNISRQFPRIVR